MSEPGEGSVALRPFCPGDQDAAKALILSGLEDHWGTLDLTLNPDLNDIAASYADGLFLVALVGSRIVGTGALVPVPPEHGDPARSPTAQIVRMSVARGMPRHGIGRRILAALHEYARAHGIRRLILETTSTWGEVIAFYTACGFRITHEEGGDTYFELHI